LIAAFIVYFVQCLLKYCTPKCRYITWTAWPSDTIAVELGRYKINQVSIPLNID